MLSITKIKPTLYALAIVFWLAFTGLTTVNAQSLDLFGLEVGNLWTYQRTYPGSPSTIEEEVVETVEEVVADAGAGPDDIHRAGQCWCEDLCGWEVHGCPARPVRLAGSGRRRRSATPRPAPASRTRPWVPVRATCVPPAARW